ncbi:hypothetical protein, partial [Parasphingorhabdus sp.]|uniref:hypothetical protein n=1 Tax=Parasphingorhabdus sp. TaxID=2709688 RepID=UPI0032EAB17F
PPSFRCEISSTKWRHLGKFWLLGFEPPNGGFWEAASLSATTGIGAEAEVPEKRVEGLLCRCCRLNADIPETTLD